MLLPGLFVRCPFGLYTVANCGYCNHQMLNRTPTRNEDTNMRWSPASSASFWVVLFVVLFVVLWVVLGVLVCQMPRNP